jgi:hypothetical protein
MQISSAKLYDLEKEANKTAIGISTIYIEALSKNNFFYADAIVQKILKDMVEESKQDKTLFIRMRLLLKAIVSLLDCSYEAWGKETLDDKLDMLQKLGLLLAGGQIVADDGETYIHDEEVEDEEIEE